MTLLSTTTGRLFPRRTTATMFALLGLTACDTLVGEGPLTPSDQQGYGAARTTDDAGGLSVLAAPDAAVSVGVASKPVTAPLGPCGQAALKAEATLQSYCSMCHGPASVGKGGFQTVLDVPSLLASGKVVPMQADSSLLYKRISTGTMPPQDVQKRPSAADVQSIADWIQCGAKDWAAAPVASFSFVGIDDRLGVVLSDLRALPNPVDRQRMRYFDLSTLANAGYTETQLQVYREAVSFLINSLSRGRDVVAPVAIDPDKLIYRIDLRDYLWDAASWNQLERVYPYAVNYNQDSRLFPYDEVSAEQVRRETNTQIPVIQGDWFLSHASRPPLYHDLLKLPASLAELQAQLGVDIDADIASEQALRAGFKNAGPSQNNRVIQRHELSGNRGALWLSFDFSNNLDRKNVFAHPLDFQQDGGELIFNLENGLQGYFVLNAAGRRLDKAPNNVVQDPLSRDGAVENGLSCMGCHQEDGQLLKSDEVRSFVLNTGSNAAETERVLALYVEAPVLSAAFSKDQNRYRSARAALSIQNVNTKTFHLLDDTHQGVIDINGVAGAIGIETAALIRALDASPQAFPQAIVTLRETGGGVQRDAFEAVLSDLVRALGLGTQLLASGSSVVTPPVATPVTPTSPVGSADAGVDTTADAGRSETSRDGGRRR
jgi:mono/diheme cytochrome c family protein